MDDDDITDTALRLGVPALICDKCKRLMPWDQPYFVHSRLVRAEGDGIDGVFCSDVCAARFALSLRLLYHKLKAPCVTEVQLMYQIPFGNLRNRHPPITAANRTYIRMMSKKP